MEPEERMGAEAPARIHVLSSELADQIAAGEVVERPASVVKELVENAVDAGATRIDVELVEAGLERIVVLDNGRGIHPDDLGLAITRHATSKVRSSKDLIEVSTLGFRGEALASIAAVARLTIQSRQATAKTGTQLLSRPGLAPEFEPIGMSVGTRIDVERLFGNVPARRKFMRSEATEVGHCSDTVLRLAIAHPTVHLRLRHGSRVLFDLPPTSLSERMRQVLERRARVQPRRIDGEHAGVGIVAWMSPPESALRHRGGMFVVVRRRVVQHRELSRMLIDAYGDTLPRGRYPVACLVVDPPQGTVDVNVHPQKAEVRFSDPQSVYTAVRSVLQQWSLSSATTTSDSSESSTVRRVSTGVSLALDRWGAAGSAGGPKSPASPSGDAPRSYRLQTQAASTNYPRIQSQLREDAETFQARLQQGSPSPTPTTDASSPAEPVPAGLSSLPASVVPLLLTCLPGPVAVFRDHDDILAIDLRRLRSFLIYRRLQQDLGGGRVEAQGLLEPVLVRRRHEDVALVRESEAALREIGMVVEPFGDDTLRVRAVPAVLRHCVEAPDIHGLVERVLPWLRLHRDDRNAGLEILAQTEGPDPAPRLARRWLRELLDDGVTLDEVPGVQRWAAEMLVQATKR